MKAIPRNNRLYVAGPMRGKPDYNFPAFDAAAARLRAQGYEVVNPAEMSREVGVEKVVTDPAVFNRLIAEELREVRACDAIYLLQGWETSLGTRDELEVALSHGLEIMLEPPHVRHEVSPKRKEAREIRAMHLKTPMARMCQEALALDLEEEAEAEEKRVNKVMSVA